MEGDQLSPIWRRWFQGLKTVDDEIRRPPAQVLTADYQVKSTDLGTVLRFDTTSGDITANLPTITANSLWAWITIVRSGLNKLTATAASGNVIEHGSDAGSIFCKEQQRKAANVTLQIVDSVTWAVIAGMGIWDID